MNDKNLDQPGLYNDQEADSAKLSSRINKQRRLYEEPFHVWKVLPTSLPAEDGSANDSNDSNDSNDDSSEDDSDYNPLEEELEHSEEPEEDELDLDWYAEVETVDQLNHCNSKQLLNESKEESEEEEEEVSVEYQKWKDQYERSNARFRAIFGCDIDTESDPVAYRQLQLAKEARGGHWWTKGLWVSMILMLLSIQWTYCIKHIRGGSNNNSDHEPPLESILGFWFTQRSNHDVGTTDKGLLVNTSMLFTECIRSREQVLHHEADDDTIQSSCLDVIDHLNTHNQTTILSHAENQYHRCHAHMYQGDMYAERSEYGPALDQYQAGLDAIEVWNPDPEDLVYGLLYQRFTRLTFMNLYAQGKHADLREHALTVLGSEMEEPNVVVLKDDAQLWLRVLRTAKKALRHEHLRQLIIRLKQEW